MIAVLMPDLSSADEGTLLGWLVEPDTQVTAGQEIVEVETDKATTTIAAENDGFLHPVARVGDTVQVGDTIGYLAPKAGMSPSVESQPGDAAPATVPTATADLSDRAPRDGSPGPGQAATTPSESATDGGRYAASPLAKRVAAVEGVDLANIRGTGRNGRIVRADVDLAIVAPRSARAVPDATSGPVDRRGEIEIIEPSKVQRLIVRRMTAVKSDVPEFTVAIGVDAEPLLALREQVRESVDRAPSVNDFVIRAGALALRAHPELNAAFVDDRFERYSRVNVGMAVAAGSSLVVPVVHDADRRTVSDIARCTRDLATRTRGGAITPEDLTGGTFTVSNLGMFGVTSFTAIINAPQAGILAVGAAVAPPGVPSAHRAMTLTLTVDHRIIYGAQAGQFMQTLKGLLESPLQILI